MSQFDTCNSVKEKDASGFVFWRLKEKVWNRGWKVFQTQDYILWLGAYLSLRTVIWRSGMIWREDNSRKKSHKCHGQWMLWDTLPFIKTLHWFSWVSVKQKRLGTGVWCSVDSGPSVPEALCSNTTTAQVRKQKTTGNCFLNCYKSSSNFYSLR